VQGRHPHHWRRQRRRWNNRREGRRLTHLFIANPQHLTISPPRRSSRTRIASCAAGLSSRSGVSRALAGS
jgi:hypothetical protein